MLCHRRDKEHVFILKGNISSRTVEDAFQVDRDNLLGAIRLHTAQDSTRDHGFFCYTVCHLNQGAYATDFVAQLVHAGTEYGSLDFYHVLKTVVDGVDCYDITVSNLEA